MRHSKVKDFLIVAKMKTASDEEKEIRLFASMVKLINHELIAPFDSSRNLIE